MHSSGKARNTGLAATAHVRPDCRGCVVILMTVTLESECTGKDRILITFSALRSRKLNFYVAFYSFHKTQERALRLLATSMLFARTN